jgi:hypothetical protein
MLMLAVNVTKFIARISAQAKGKSQLARLN